MIIIYDFDGTLTPYSLPQYEVLKKCGYDDKKLNERIAKTIKVDEIGLYEAYYKCYVDILKENKIAMTMENFCLGADKVQFNKGVVEYFEKYQSSNTGIKHYIVTSGLKDYVEKTAIGKLVDGVYGATFKQENGLFTEINTLLTDEKKVEIIKKIQVENDNTNQIIYYGDGLTDKFAFEYVHSIGGKNVFIASNEQSMINYNKLNANKIIDQCFEGDFTSNSKISKYIQKIIAVDQT